MASTINDERLVAVKAEEEKDLNKSNTMYNSMIKDSQDAYNAQIQASKDYAKEQTKLQQEQLDFTLDKIDQQKEQANKDYIKEQSGAYVDWQKESNRYGANAEEMASSGFVSSGYGESSQVSMYNTYQNRVMTAREAYNKAVLEYDNMMKDAKLQNSSVLAEIAYNALQKQLELTLQGLQYNNQLLEAQANKQLEIKSLYHNQYQDVLDQINTENALAEQIRQYNENLAMEKAKLEEEKRQHDETLAEQKRQFDLSYSKSSGSGGGSGGGSSGGSSGSSGSGSTYTSKSSNQVNTAYYSGSLNRDAANGTFSNGYQPDNVNGKKLSKTGDTVTFNTQTLYGQKQTVTQNIWKDSSGTKYYWEGRENRYIEVNNKKTGRSPE